MLKRKFLYFPTDEILCDESREYFEEGVLLVVLM
jgi:hypothetical protein